MAPRAGSRKASTAASTGGRKDSVAVGVPASSKRRSVSGAGRRVSRASRASRSENASPTPDGDTADAPPSFSPVLGRHSEIPPMPDGGDTETSQSLTASPMARSIASAGGAKASFDATSSAALVPATSVSPPPDTPAPQAATATDTTETAPAAAPTPATEPPAAAPAANGGADSGGGGSPSAKKRPIVAGGSGMKASAVLRSEQYFAQKEEKRRAKYVTLFKDFDDNGDGHMDLAEATNLFVEALGGSDLDPLDAAEVFGDADTTQVSLEDFVALHVYDNLQDLHRGHSAADRERLTEIRERLALSSKMSAEFLPRRVFAHVVGFVDLRSLWELTHTSTAIRDVASMDCYWQPLILRKKKQEMMQTVKSAGMLPEVLPKHDLLRWYKGFKKDLSASAGRQQWDLRMKRETVDGATVMKVDHLPSYVGLIPPPPPGPPEDPPEGEDPPPPPPPGPPLLAHGDEKGDVELRALDNIATIHHSLHEHDAAITCTTTSDKFVFVGSDDCTVTVWGRESFGRPEFILVAHKEAVSCVEAAPWDDTLVVTGSMDRDVIIWKPLVAAPIKRRKSTTDVDIPPIQPKVICSGHSMKVQQIIVRQNAVYSAARDSIIIIWSWAGSVLHKITGHMGPVNCIGFVQDWFQPQVKANGAGALADGDGPPTSPRSHVSVSSRKSVDASRKSLDASQEGRPADSSKLDMLVSCCGGGFVKGWTASGRQHFSKRVHESPIELMHVCEDPRLKGCVITGGWDNLIMMYSVVCSCAPSRAYTHFTANDSIMMQFRGHMGSIRSLVVDESRGRIVSGSDDCAIYMWRFHDIDPRLARREPVELTPYYALAASKSSVGGMVLAKHADGRWYSLVARSQDRSVFSWRFAEDSPLQSAGLDFG